MILRKLILLNTLCFTSILASTASANTANANWQERLKAEVPVMGHRNWIIIADSAYPKQSSPGIETIYTGAEHVEVLKTVLSIIEQSKHIRPIVYVDAELKALNDSMAPGIESLKKKMETALSGMPVKKLLHEEIIHKLDKDSEVFNVLILKTDLTLPYTSVFLQLDCGYWSAEKEAELRAAMKKGQ